MKISNSFEIICKPNTLTFNAKTPKNSHPAFQAGIATKPTASRSCTQNTGAAKVQQTPCGTLSQASSSARPALQTAAPVHVHKSLHQANFTAHRLLRFLFLLHPSKIRLLSHCSWGGSTSAFELLNKTSYCPAINCT